MLVLSRKAGEDLIIGNKTRVAVVEIRGDKVRLGIVAPKEIPIHRGEVWAMIHGKQWRGPLDADGGPSLH